MPNPSNAEIAALFTEEASQRHRLAGLNAYEAMILNHNPTLAGQPFLPDDDPPEDEPPCHPIFQKCRWYDLKRPVSEGFPATGTLDPDLPAGALWSVDEPVVWAALRPCLRMASRVFEASLALPFWDAILDAQPGTATHRWDEKRGLGEGLRDVPHRAVDRHPRDQRSQEALRRHFDTYARHIAFSFFPVPDAVNSKAAGTFLPSRQWEGVPTRPSMER